MSSIMTATFHLLLFSMKAAQKLWNFHLDTFATHLKTICLAKDKPAQTVEAKEAALMRVSHLHYTNHGSQRQ